MIKPQRRTPYDRTLDSGTRVRVEVAEYYKRVEVRAYIREGDKMRPIGKAILQKTGSGHLQASPWSPCAAVFVNEDAAFWRARNAGVLA